MRWSLLAAFGNTPIAKAVVFTPVVAGYVFYSSTYLEAQWGFRNALWLYWSLIALSIGQLVYTIRAPGLIKRHGNKLSAFVDEGLSTFSQRRLQLMASSYVAKFIDIPSMLGSEASDVWQAFDQRMEKFAHSDPGPDTYASARWLLQALRRNSPIRPDVTSRRVIEQQLLHMLKEIAQRPLTERETSNVAHAVQFVNSPANSDDWKKQILEHEFMTTETSNAASRTIVASFYAIGACYFVWNTAKTLSNVASVTLDQIVR